MKENKLEKIVDLIDKHSSLKLIGKRDDGEIDFSSRAVHLTELFTAPKKGIYSDQALNNYINEVENYFSQNNVYCDFLNEFCQGDTGSGVALYVGHMEFDQKVAETITEIKKTIKPSGDIKIPKKYLDDGKTETRSTDVIKRTFVYIFPNEKIGKECISDQQVEFKVSIDQLRPYVKSLQSLK